MQRWQMEVSKTAAMAALLAANAGWWQLETLLAPLAAQVAAGVRPELLALMKVGAAGAKWRSHPTHMPCNVMHWMCLEQLRLLRVYFAFLVPTCVPPLLRIACTWGVHCSTVSVTGCRSYTCTDQHIRGSRPELLPPGNMRECGVSGVLDHCGAWQKNVAHLEYECSGPVRFLPQITSQLSILERHQKQQTCKHALAW